MNWYYSYYCHSTVALPGLLILCMCAMIYLYAIRAFLLLLHNKRIIFSIVYGTKGNRPRMISNHLQQEDKKYKLEVIKIDFRICISMTGLCRVENVETTSLIKCSKNISGPWYSYVHVLLPSILPLIHHRSII